MAEQNDTRTMRKIKKTYGRIVVVAGTVMGLVMCTYLFTLGILIDGGHTSIMWFEVVTAVLFVLGFIYLKPLVLFITRILLSRNADSRRALKGMTVADIEKVPQ
jgi:Kef-type K+ transport system membrane component KefB